MSCHMHQTFYHLLRYHHSTSGQTNYKRWNYFCSVPIFLKNQTFIFIVVAILPILMAFCMGTRIQFSTGHQGDKSFGLQRQRISLLPFYITIIFVHDYLERLHPRCKICLPILRLTINKLLYLFINKNLVFGRQENTIVSGWIKKS